jgi:hypothetical protein
MHKAGIDKLLVADMVMLPPIGLGSAGSHFINAEL